MGDAGKVNTRLLLERLVPPSVEQAQWWARAHLATLAMTDEGEILDEWMLLVLRRLEGFDGGAESCSEEELAIVKERMLAWRPSANDSKTNCKSSWCNTGRQL